MKPTPRDRRNIITRTKHLRCTWRAANTHSQISFLTTEDGGRNCHLNLIVNYVPSPASVCFIYILFARLSKILNVNAGKGQGGNVDLDTTIFLSSLLVSPGCYRTGLLFSCFRFMIALLVKFSSTKEDKGHRSRIGFTTFISLSSPTSLTAERSMWFFMVCSTFFIILRKFPLQGAHKRSLTPKYDRRR